METVAVFVVAFWVAFYTVQAVGRAVRARRTIGARTQVQIGGDGSTQIQVGRDLAVTVNPPNPASPRPPRGGSGQSTGYIVPAQQIRAVADDMTRRLNGLHTYENGGIRLPDVRNGGPFSTIATCPACGTYGLHPMRTPNPETPEREYARDAHGHIVASWADRWDETPYETVRTCLDPACKWEWGHAAPTAITGNARLDDAIDQIKTDPRRYFEQQTRPERLRPPAEETP